MIMNIDINNCLIKKIKNVIQHYDHDLYWKCRAVVVDTLNKISKYKNGLNGIIIAHDAFIGKNVTIYQQVTIPYKECGVPNIGSNVEIGAGAKLLGKIIIGIILKLVPMPWFYRYSR